MRRTTRYLLSVGVVAYGLSSLPLAASPATPLTKDGVNQADYKQTGKSNEAGAADPTILRAEVMLDRMHISPGVIDGRNGENFIHALEAFETVRHLDPAKGLNAKNWAALLADNGSPVLVDHTLTDKEVEGPFFPDLPSDYGALAKLKTIGYRSPAQKIGAQFHMGEALLAALNPGADLSKAGTKILVADVTLAASHGTLTSVVVDKKKSQVLALDRHGAILAAYPATIGSRELPSPSGTYKVKGIAFDPVYYYDPDNFLQGANKEKLKLPPGPNNPVGTVFIALTKPTYGLHGTPDPSKIDKTASHGCVRMTNWDARDLAHQVKRGVVVRFKG